MLKAGDLQVLTAVTGPTDVALLVLGALVVITVISSAARTVVLPDGHTPRMARATFAVAKAVGSALRPMVRSPQRRHTMLSGVPAFALLGMPVVWLAGALVGFTLVFKALGESGWRDAYGTAGSSLFTLGFSNLGTLPAVTAEFLAAAISISILALLIVTYLPTLYGVYSRREALVSALETSAGARPEAAEMLVRYHRIAGLDRLDQLWQEWGSWFDESRETHTALPMVVLFRSASAERSWILSVAAVLDAAALRIAAVDEPYDPVAPLCVRSGYLCLRDIAAPHRIGFDPDPSPDDPISIGRDDFDASYDKLLTAGLPVHPREQAWVDFSGWRVNYDTLVCRLAQLLSVDPPPLTKRPAESPT